MPHHEAKLRVARASRSSLDRLGQELWDEIVHKRGSAALGGDGLQGPYNAWVVAPDVGRCALELGRSRFRSTVPAALFELAILTVTAHWGASFEFGSHVQAGLDAGLLQETIDALWPSGAQPDQLPGAQSSVYRFSKQVVRDGRVDDATFDEVHQAVGTRGLVDLVSACGFYTLVSFTVNVFETDS